MEKYNIYFEIASVCFLILIIALIKIKRQLNIYQNKLFFRGLCVLVLLNVVDAFSATLINYENLKPGVDVPIMLSWSVTMASYVIQQVLIQLFLYYFLLADGDGNRLKNIAYRFMSVVSLLYGLLVLTTPITHLIFYFDENGTYCFGRLHIILYVVVVLFCIYGLFFCWNRRAGLSRHQKKGVLFFVVATIGLVSFQIFVVPEVLLLYFWLTIVLAAVFLTLQSPDFYLDRTTNAFNQDGLTVVLNDRIKRKTPFSVLFIPVYDFENINGGFSTENKRLVYRKICEQLFQLPKTDVFREDDKLYVFFYEPAKAEEYAMKVGKWLTEGVDMGAAHGEVKLKAKMLLFDFPGRVSNEEEFYSAIRYFLMDDYYKHFNELEFINEEFFRKKKRYEDVRHLVEEAIRTDGVEIYYQPIYSTLKDEFHSAEALVRLKDKETIGFVSPEEFIPIAEKENLILQLEDIILRKICSFVRREKIYNMGLQYIEVNLSGNQCMQADLFEQLSELIDEYGISPNFINFEVTETSTIDNSECLIRNMEQLQKYGSTFALDDYGSGCSNLKYLVDFPFEIVKLDKDIVWTYFGAKNPKSRSVLPLSVNMLREMNVRIVAEGVETKEQKDELVRMGVQYLQGYYFSKPICEKDFIEFLKKNNECA